MVVEGDGSTAAICPPDREILAKVTIVFGPKFVLSAITVVITVKGVACVIGGIVFGKGLHDIEFYPWIACETIESKVRVSLRIVVCSEVDHSSMVLAE
jgi:hypothetical protein